jgi:hypothetical protein
MILWIGRRIIALIAMGAYIRMTLRGVSHEEAMAQINRWFDEVRDARLKRERLG